MWATTGRAHINAADAHSNAFLDLPYDIFQEICDYLSDLEFIGLQFISRAVSLKLPPSRLEEIRSRHTIFYIQRDIGVLKRLASRSLKDRAQIKHIIFDISYPYVRLVSRGCFDQIIAQYPDSIHQKLIRFCEDYKARNESPDLPQAARRGSVSKITYGISNALRSPRNSRIGGRPASLPFYSRSRLAHNSPLYSILRQNEYKKREVWSTLGDHSFYETFCRTLTETLKTLPNVRILETRYKSRRETPRDTLTAIWKRYNPHIKTLIAKYPELERLPWHDWFEHERRTIGESSLSRPDYAPYFEPCHSTLVACAVAACREISEIRTNMTHTAWHGTPYGGTVTQPSKTYPLNSIDAITRARRCKRAFANLNRVELSILPENFRNLGSWDLSHTNSSLFLDILRNAQDLVIRRPTYWGILPEVKPVFPISVDSILPKLRRLEIVEAAIQINPLIQFLKINATRTSSLKELVCRSTFSETTGKLEIIEILTVLKSDLQLDVCKIDFLTNDTGKRQCYLRVDIRERLGKYHVGTRCGPQSSYFVHPIEEVSSTEERESMVQTHWVGRISWEELILDIQEIETRPLEACEHHWDGKMLRDWPMDPLGTLSLYDLRVF
ncbi:hypothetical protein TWF730_010163 [Orbilia blumenaviensis]|uniref:F-box domain-containing protein n=1 Tax=Orbilia blumenaviensis TaxID=1796055 RepID=A0AAV9UQZ6_9PEZI